MRNEEWFNFFAEFKKFVEETSPETLNVEELFVMFLVLFADVDTVMEVMRKSSYTSILVSLDDKRDETFRGLTTAVESAAHHFDPLVKEAAENLAPLWNHYGNLAGRPFNEETSAIVNFIQELRGKFAPAIQTLGLTGWVDELERRNDAFETAVLDRNRESADKSELHVLGLRKKIDRCYLDIIERIEAQILLQGDETFATFVKTLNANIDRYLAVLNRRGGKKVEKEEEK
jgi:hypothetical protein